MEKYINDFSFTLFFWQIMLFAFFLFILNLLRLLYKFLKNYKKQP